MKNLRGAAANILRPDKITPKERDAIIAAIKENPTPAGDKIVAEKFGRSHRTIERLRHAWQNENGIVRAGGLMKGYGGAVSEPFRQRAALDFAKKYGKSFTIRTAKEYLGEYSSYPALFRRLAVKGFFTIKTVKLHVPHMGGSNRLTRVLVITPTAQLLDE